ncbi:ABC transporter permease [Cupriavidus campinensis]|uniref:ABC-2 type transporter domain-containing protein n=1 Tax=Cupriavidus campinensis TaxID=151783 RepID=A0AAE9HXX1_9BURK|nr:hypothetical protein [Cupriavidus campinensis]URF03414.1 hypothetical protein M5D45_12865 [Cupriavidus campinensis]
MQLFIRTIGAKYRKSFLGYFWMIFPAILVSGGVSMASGAGVINPGEVGLPYLLFAFLGTLIWQVFAEAFEVPFQAFQGARTYLTRVNFPRGAVVLAQTYESLITMAVRLGLSLLLVAVFHGITVTGIALMVIGFVGALLLGIGLGLLLTPFMLLFADLHNTVKLILSYGMFLTPAVYIPKEPGLFATVVNGNPIAPLMQVVRDGAASSVLNVPLALGVSLVTAMVLIVVGMALLRLAAPIVIERMLLGGR